MCVGDKADISDNSSMIIVWVFRIRGFIIRSSFGVIIMCMVLDSAVRSVLFLVISAKNLANSIVELHTVRFLDTYIDGPKKVSHTRIVRTTKQITFCLILRKIIFLAAADLTNAHSI